MTTNAKKTTKADKTKRTQRLTKPMLVQAIQASLGEQAPSRAHIETIIDTMTGVMTNAIKAGFLVEVPNIVKIRTVAKEATPARKKMNYFTKQMMDLPAKPACKRVKVTPTRALKAAV